MKKLIVLAVAVSVLSACAPRNQSPEEAAMTRAAIKGAAMQQALSNAHEAAFPSQHAQGFNAKRENALRHMPGGVETIQHAQAAKIADPLHAVKYSGMSNGKGFNVSINNGFTQATIPAMSANWKLTTIKSL